MLLGIMQIRCPGCACARMSQALQMTSLPSRPAALQVQAA